ncbi:MAG: TetR/AcrR family transcriptional regulator [Phycisphaerales bacterium JB039]
MATPSSSAIPGVTPPQQERSRETYERILDAVERLLLDRDFAQLRIEDALAEADVSIGSFYARFSGKEALLPALVERYRVDVERLMQAPELRLAADASLEARAKAFVQTRVRRFQRRKGLLRALVIEQRRSPGPHHRELQEVARRANEQVVALFMPRAQEIHGDARQTILRAMYFVSAICRDRILFGASPHASVAPLPLSQLEAELTRLMLGYLRGSGLE